MRTAIIISHKGETAPSIEFGDAQQIKDKFRDLVEKGGGGADVVEMWTSSSGRSKKRKFNRRQEAKKPEPTQEPAQETAAPPIPAELQPQAQPEHKPPKKGRK